MNGPCRRHAARAAPAKLTTGEIASLSGPQDDAWHFQISVPVPVLAHSHDSGGALVDERPAVAGWWAS